MAHKNCEEKYFDVKKVLSLAHNLAWAMDKGREEILIAQWDLRK